MPTVTTTARNRSTPLKDRNRIPLIGVMGLNFVVLFAAMKTGNLMALGIDNVKQWHDFLPAGVGVIIAGVVNGLLSANSKARLVFWRWSNPLPGSFAFSRYAQQDPRIDPAALGKITDSWPSDPTEQNRLWYRLYKSVENEPAVTDAHRHFLLTRDYTAIAFLLLMTAGPLGFYFIASMMPAIAYVGLLMLQYLLARQAASNYGVRFVTSVLALKASGR